MKSGKIEILQGVDSKGRIVIPASVRKKLNINENDRVEIVVKRVEHRRSFSKYFGELKGAGDANKLLHEESPFR